MPHRMAACHIRSRETGAGKRWDVRYRRGGRYFPLEHAGTFRTLKDARTRKALVAGWLAAGLNPAVELRRTMGEASTVAALCDDWLASRRSVASRTLVEYRRYADVIAARFDGQPSDVTPRDVRAWIGELEAKHKPGTVALYVRALRMILDHADLPVNPARHRSVELPRVPHRTLSPPDGGDILAVVASLPQRYRLPVVLIEQTGLRVTEAVMLANDDVEPTRIRVRVEHSKTHRPRWAPAPQWLTAHLHVLPVSGNRQTIHNALKRACKDAGLTPFGPHMLRHRRATLWHQQGVPPVEAAARLGHSPNEYLRTYAHVKRLTEAPAHLLDSLLR